MKRQQRTKQKQPVHPFHKPKNKRAWRMVERAYEQMEQQGTVLHACLPKDLTDFEVELIRAAFAIGRRSYAEDCDEDREIMRELGMVA